MIEELIEEDCTFVFRAMCTAVHVVVHVYTYTYTIIFSYFRTFVRVRVHVGPTVINKVRRLACFVSLKSVCELSRILSLSYLSRSLLLFSTRTRTVHLCVHYVVPTRTVQHKIITLCMCTVVRLLYVYV